MNARATTANFKPGQARAQQGSKANIDLEYSETARPKPQASRSPSQPVKHAPKQAPKPTDIRRIPVSFGPDHKLLEHPPSQVKQALKQSSEATDIRIIPESRGPDHNFQKQPHSQESTKFISLPNKPKI